MSIDGILRTNQFNQVVLDSTQGETLGENYEAMKAALHLAMGNVPVTESPASTLPAASTFKCEREIRWAESLHRRPLVIRANSEAELDELENQILYQR